MNKKWTELGAYQKEFAEAVAQLIVYAAENGIRLRLKDAYRGPRLHGAWGKKQGYGAAHSCHKVSLAVDLWTLDPTNHRHLHDFWDRLGGAPRIEGDMTHYSFEWQGHR